MALRQEGRTALVSARSTLYLSLAAFAISANAVPPLLSTIARDLALPPWALGTAVTLQFAAFACVSLFGDRIRRSFGLGLRAMIAIGLAVLSLALLSAPIAIVSLASIAPWILLLGCAGGLVETSSSVLLAGGAEEATSKPLCLSQAFYAAGAFAAPLAAKACLAGGGGWKAAFLAFGAFSGLVALAFAAAHRGGSGPSALQAAPSPRADAAEPATGGVAALFGLLVFAYVVAESFCGAWMPFMLEELRALPARDAASASSLFWLGMILGRLAVLALPDRWSLGPALAACPVLAAASAWALGAGGPPALLAALGFSMGPVWPVAVKLASSALRSEARTGAVIAAGGLGAAAGPLLGSLLVGRGLARRYFIVVAVLCSIVPCIAVAALAAGKKGKA